jgi:hypothetical protein
LRLIDAGQYCGRASFLRGHLDLSSTINHFRSSATPRQPLPINEVANSLRPKPASLFGKMIEIVGRKVGSDCARIHPCRGTPKSKERAMAIAQPK